jgi:hypothetical protein
MRLVLVLALFASLQATQVGTIEGTVMRQGSTDPIPEVQITVGGNGLILLPRQAQAVLDAAAGGLPVSDEILQAAQYSLRNGGVIGRGADSVLQRAVTDSAGHFTIQNVPAGNTVIRAQLQGYFDAPMNSNYPTTIVSNVTVTAQKTAEIQLSMIPGGSVSGRVLDPAGKPLADSIVQILQPLYQNGVRTLVPVDLKATDDRGEYRLSRLPPGEYYLSASPPRTPNASTVSEVPLTTLHPNAIEMAAATPIILRPGDEQSGNNIQIRTAASVKVSGKVISMIPPAAGQRGQGRPTSVALVPREPSALPDPTIGGLVPVSSDGSFEIPNIPAGAYDLIARAPLPANKGWGAGNAPALAGNPWAFGRTPVDVRGQNVSDISIVVRGGFDVTGHLIVDGKASAANVRIGLVTVESVTRVADAQTLNTFGQIATFQPTIGADGSFTIPLLPEGKYRFQVGIGGIVSATAAAATTPLPATAYIADVKQGAVSVYDNGMSIGGEAVNPVQLLVNTDGGSIEGITTGLDRKPTAAMTVVLVPAESRRQNPALYKSVRSDAQGHFQISAVQPGQYKIFAWENVPSGAWQNTEFLSRFEERGIPANVMPGTRTTVEVQSIRTEAN